MIEICYFGTGTLYEVSHAPCTREEIENFEVPTTLFYTHLYDIKDIKKMILDGYKYLTEDDIKILNITKSHTYIKYEYEEK